MEGELQRRQPLILATEIVLNMRTAAARHRELSIKENTGQEL